MQRSSAKQVIGATKTLPIKASPGSTFSISSNSAVSSSGITHTRYQQHINDTPVWTAEMIVHSGTSTRVTGKVLKDIDSSVISSAKYTESEVYEHVVSLLNKKFTNTSHLKIVKRKIKPYIFRKNDGSLINTFLVDVFLTGDQLISRPQVMIDASSLSVVKFWDGLQHLSVDGTGPGGNEKTGRYDYGTDFSTFGVNEQNGTCTMENTNVKAVDLLHSMDELYGEINNTAFSYDCSTADNYLNTYKEINGAYSPINDAFFFGNLVFDMYDQWYSTSPLPSPEPMQLSMKVHLGINLENAFWTGEAMLLGDGGASLYPLVDINVSAHEVSHGFTQFNSDLIYSNESGGMNEAFSDMAGEAAEFFMKGDVDWLVGADIYRGAGALRYFEDPAQDGSSIKHVENYADGLNVHLSSGIYNHAFYLLANTPGWSVKTAFDVFVYANQNYWISDETFIGGVCGTISAATALEYNITDVALAFKEVGLECPTFVIDSDQDLMSDIWEEYHGFNPFSADDASFDFDNDGLSNLEEYNRGLEAKFNDSDRDGLHDSAEIILGTDPLMQDTDNDGMSDGFEVANGLSPFIDDSAGDLDGDGLNNLLEFVNKLNPVARDDLIPTNRTDDFERSISPDWKNESDIGWHRTEVDEGFVLASGKIDDSQYTQIDIEMYVLEGSELLFDLKTRTEDRFDFFVLKVNGISVYALSGEHDWQPISYRFGQEGVVKVSFVYEKDFTGAPEDDRVYIDNIIRPVQFEPVDFDNDGMFDYWESFYGIEHPELDQDNDGLTNLEEFLVSSSPLLADSDKDGLSDAVEVNQYRTSPINKDSDFDGISDGDEIDNELDPLDASDAKLDFDEDGYSNIAEVLYGGAVNDAAIQSVSLLNFNDEFNGSEINHIWSSTEQQALPHGTYGKWLLVGQRFQPQEIANGMLAVAHINKSFEAGVLTFDLSMNTEEDHDEFIVYIDGEIYASFSGVQEKEVLVQVTGGIHEVSFVYKKNASKSSVIDSVSIDNLTFLAEEDLDGDGFTNSYEISIGTNLRLADSDRDGHADSRDAFPNEASEWMDSDNDGYGDNQDAFPNNYLEWIDSDSDGHGDNSDVFPHEASEWMDSDNDGYGDNQDAFPNNYLEWIDSDSDGHGDNSDVFPHDASEWMDSDNDSYGDNIDFSPRDSGEWVDSDLDGHGDNRDAFPNDDSEWIDSDNDGQGDNSDYYPNDAKRWVKQGNSSSGAGSINYFWLLLLVVFSFRRKTSGYKVKLNK